MKKINKDSIKFIILIAIIIIVLFLVWYLNAAGFVSSTLFRDTMTQMGTLAPIIFLIVYIIATIFFLPATPLTIASGIIFGKGFGTLYVVIGATIGATIAFLVSRFLGKGFVDRILKGKYKKVYEYDKKLEESGLLVVLFLRLIPVFPFNGLNFALGLTKVKKRHFIIGTLIGIIPGTFLLAFFGDSLKQLNIVNILIAVVLFLLLIFSPKIYKKVYKKKNNNINNGKI